MSEPSRAVRAGYVLASGLYAVAVISAAAIVLSILVGLWLLRGFLRSVLDGEPFGAANVQRLRGIGSILLVGAPVVELIDWSLRQALFNRLPAHRSLDVGVAGFSLPGAALVGGLGAFILAEVLAYGQRLREDVEATI